MFFQVALGRRNVLACSRMIQRKPRRSMQLDNSPSDLWSEMNSVKSGHAYLQASSAAMHVNVPQVKPQDLKAS